MARGRDILLSSRLKLAKGHSRDLHRAPKHHCSGFVIPVSLTLAAMLLSPCYRPKELELGLLILLLEKLLPSLTKAVKARALSRQAPSPGRHCNRQVRVTVDRVTVQEKMGPQLGKDRLKLSSLLTQLVQ